MLKRSIRYLFFGFSMLTLIKEVKCGMGQRIVGGKAINSSDAPYHLIMKYEGQYFCGAGLFTTRCAVTAAHCFVPAKEFNKTIIHGGVSKLNSISEVTRKLIALTIHSGFDHNKMINDIAVIKIKPIRHEKVKPICMSNQTLRARQKAAICGFGLTKETDWEPSELLNMVELKVMGKKKCMQLYGNRVDVSHPSMFCTESITGETDACSGDSGGALVCNKRIIGIVSFGIGCARSDSPGVWANIKNLLDFVIDAAGKMGCGHVCTN